jgi:pyruvate/2-oxoglutarate dehydrogenase complex dihydrolipoamide acyltransferase (E2) component
MSHAPVLIVCAEEVRRREDLGHACVVPGRPVPSQGGKETMKEQHGEDQVVAYPKVRRFLEAAIRSTHHKPMIHGLLEVDVSRARAHVRDHQAKTGECLSFTAFLMACLAKAVDEHKGAQAMRLGSNHLILFADVDVLTYIERDVAGQKQIMPYIVRAANRKTFLEIHHEIRAAQEQPLAEAEVGGAKTLQFLPAVLFRPYFWISAWIGRRYPRVWKNNWGTVTLSAVGMFGEGAGWGIPPTIPSLCWITVGGIGEKPGVVDGQIAIREYLGLTASFDHNMIDGAQATRFTERLKELIESSYGLTGQEAGSVLNETETAATGRLIHVPARS